MQRPLQDATRTAGGSACWLSCVGFVALACVVVSFTTLCHAPMVVMAQSGVTYAYGMTSASVDGLGGESFSDAQVVLFVTNTLSHTVGAYFTANTTFRVISGSRRGAANGTRSTAWYRFPFGLTFVPSTLMPSASTAPMGSFVFVADFGNGCVRRVHLDTLYSDFIAGNCGNVGIADSSAPMGSRLLRPLNMWPMFSGSSTSMVLLVTDHVAHCIWRVDVTAPVSSAVGNVSSYAGRCGSDGQNSTDGSTATALLQRPSGIAGTAAGMVVYFTQWEGNSAHLRRVDQSCMVTTLVSTSVLMSNVFQVFVPLHEATAADYVYVTADDAIRMLPVAGASNGTALISVAQSTAMVVLSDVAYVTRRVVTNALYQLSGSMPPVRTSSISSSLGVCAGTVPSLPTTPSPSGSSSVSQGVIIGSVSAVGGVLIAALVIALVLIHKRRIIVMPMEQEPPFSGAQDIALHPVEVVRVDAAGRTLPPARAAPWS